MYCINMTSKVKKKRAILVEIKKEIIKKHENGTRLTDLAFDYAMPKTTISSILRNKEAIKKAKVAKGVTILTPFKRTDLHEELEQLLVIWINEKRSSCDNLSEATIREKAKQLHNQLVEKTPKSSAQSEREFRASHGWFRKFRKRAGIHGISGHGEAVSTDVKAQALTYSTFTHSGQLLSPDSVSPRHSTVKYLIYNLIYI